MRVTVSDLALKETTHRLFPESKNRSARIHKKLVKRHGGEFVKVPCMWKIGDHIIAHPSLYAQLKEAVVPQSTPPGPRRFW